MHNFVKHPHPTTTRCPSRVAPQPTCLRSVARTARKPPRPAHESATHGHARRSGCVSLSGSGQPAPPACRSRLRSAGCAVCPSRRSHTQATLSVPRGASHTQPTLWAWPAGRSACAGRVGSSRRRALRYGRWAAAPSFSFAGGGGVWMSSRPSPRGSERNPAATSPTGSRTAATRPRRAPRIPEGAGARDSPDAACGRLRGLPDLRRSRPPSPGSRNACAGSLPPPAPAPRPSRQGSGRIRPRARVRVRRGGSAPRLGQRSSRPRGRHAPARSRAASRQRPTAREPLQGRRRLPQARPG